MKAAIFEDGAQVIGYLGWGLIDILSSQGDMRKRYGVVYVNRENHDLKGPAAGAEEELCMVEAGVPQQRRSDVTLPWRSDGVSSPPATH